MAIDKIFKSTNLDDVADNILSEVDDFVFSVDKMQQRKVAGNVQKVVQAFRQIETELQKRYDNVTDVLEKRITSINDGRDGLNGIDGRSGRDGKPGRDGVNGKQGPPGTPGKDGIDGVNGVSVTNANIDFDGSLVISLSTGEQINVGEVVPPELERQLVELRQGGSAGSSGDVIGPTSSTDNAIARFDGTTGKVVQNSVVTIDDTTGNMTGVGTFNATGLATLTAGAVVQGLTVGLGAGAVATNMAMGANALNANTSGQYNVCVGPQTGFTNTSGYGNTFMGSRSNYANTAGYSNVDGYYNTAVGASSLAYNTSGFFNAAFGMQTLLLNTTGVYNTAIGSSALTSNDSGANNTAVGYAALALNTTASNNTAVGYQAGYGITTGSKNVIIGGYSGNQGGLDIRTASNYIVLSDGDGNPLVSTNSTRSVALNGAVPQTGTGITFPATQSASSNANTLDDYEEGTWTPTVANMTTTGSPSYAGVYTKIGNLVLVNFYSTNASGTTYAATAGSTYVTGLPFTTKNTSTAFQPWTGTSGNGNTTAGGIVGVGGNDITVYFMTTLTATIGVAFTLLYLV